MKCLNCGKEAEDIICTDCRTENVLNEVFNTIYYFKDEICENEYIKEYMKKFEKARDARKELPYIINLFDESINEFYSLKYLRNIRDEAFENKAIKFLKKFDKKNKKQQSVLYDLLTFYIPNDFEKPLKWCEIIMDSNVFCAELKLVAAEFFSMTAEYDIAEKIVKELEVECNKKKYNNYIFSDKEKTLENINKRKNLLERYRSGKPYWPSTEERRMALVPIYNKKGIKCPEIELKPKKVKESDFENISECNLKKMDNYCAFWCSGVQNLTRVFVIFEIAAVKVRDNKIVDEFQKYIKPWDGISIAQKIEKKYGINLKELYEAENVDKVMKHFFEFVGKDVLVSTEALAEQAKLITRAARYSNMTKINNEFFELLDYAADISEKFDLENNNREYLLNYFNLIEGKDSLEKAKKNIEIYNNLKKWVNSMKLTINQKKAINEIDNHLQIVACAGSGKTEVITRRIANILEKKTDVNPSEIVAFTFTEKAAESMKRRILKALTESDSCRYTQEEIKDRMYIGTIHGFCYKLLKKYVSEFSDFSVLDSVKNYLFIERYFDVCGATKLDIKYSIYGIKLFIECIEKLISDYENYDSWEDVDKDVFDTYRKFLYEKKYLDFSSIIFETINQMSINEEIRNYILNIKYLVVDEYQDVDDMQEKLIGLFYKNGTNICVVGDDDQTIYRFRGSNAENMISFAKRYSNVVQVKLEDNFRCAEGIIDVANEVVKNNENRIIKKMIANKDTKNSIVVAEEYSTIWEQYEGIAKNIQRLKQEGHEYNEIAVLVRKGKSITDIVKCLEELDIPYVTNNAEHFFKGNYFERFIMTLDNLSKIDKGYLYDCWKDAINISFFNKGFRYLRKISNSGGNGKQLPLSSVIENFLNEVEFFNEKYEDYQERKDSFKGITDIFKDFDEIYKDYQLTARVNKLIDFLENEAAEQYKYHNFREKEEDDAVQIMTVHKSKGLEFNTVFIPRVEYNEFPSRRIGGKKYWHVLGESFQENKEKFETDIEDERKLFYVAVTRAKQNLFLTYSFESKESQFLKEAKNSKYLILK